MVDDIFRGKCTENSEWVYGHHVHYDDIKHNGKDDCDYIVEKHNGEYFPFREVFSETVGRLTQINGIQFGEGDIVEVSASLNGETKAYGVVMFGEFKSYDFGEFKSYDVDFFTGFYIKWVGFLYQDWRKSIKWWLTHRDLKIVGNIYDNPEILLKED